MKTLIASLLLATALVAPASAAPSVNGNVLVERCTSPAWTGYCFGFMRATGDTFMFWRDVAPESAHVCLPKEVTAEQLRDVALLYIKKTPKWRHESATALLALAFLEAWPCQDIPSATFKGR